MQQLESLGLSYEIIACDPELADTQVFAEHYDVALDDCANTILVKTRTGEAKFAACVVLATCRLDVNHIIRKRLGARKASFASAEETTQLTGMMVGGVTPIGLPSGLPLWIDSAVMLRPLIIIGGGHRARKISISPQLFHLTANTEIVTGLANPMPAWRA